MQQAVFQHFPHDQGTYRFTHRDKDVPFTRECIELFTKSIHGHILFTLASNADPTITQNSQDYL
jgi:hypothetical protein